MHKAELQCSTEGDSTQCSDSSSSGLPQCNGHYPPRACALLAAVAVSNQANLRSALLQNQPLQIACHPSVWARKCAAELNPTAAPGRPRQCPLPNDPVAGPGSVVLLLRTSVAESTSAAEQVGPHQLQNWSHCPDFHPPHSARRASREAHRNDPASPQSKVRAPLHQWHGVCACVKLQTFCICMAHKFQTALHRQSGSSGSAVCTFPCCSSLALVQSMCHPVPCSAARVLDHWWGAMSLCLAVGRLHSDP